MRKREVEGRGQMGVREIKNSQHRKSEENKEMTTSWKQGAINMSCSNTPSCTFRFRIKTQMYACNKARLQMTSLESTSLQISYHRDPEVWCQKGDPVCYSKSKHTAFKSTICL